jgi:hypothetical protein
VDLESSLSESSGLLFLNHKLITHNDSQGEAALFELDSLTGQFDRKVTIGNASNIDWEDIAADQDYIYIGDFGNNAGNRSELKIYRISQLDYWSASNDTVFADTIRFNYLSQTDFSSYPNATNFDCEAMTIINDSIYLFSKNWLNQKTYVYVLSKNIGNYSLPIRDSISVQGLITGADFNTYSNRLVLTGNTPFSPFIVEIDWDNTLPLSQLSRNRYSVSVLGSIQVEAISTISENRYYLTAEAFSGNPANLMLMEGRNGSLFVENILFEWATIFPNPVEGNLHLQFRSILPEVKIILSNLLGEVVFQEDYSNTNRIQIGAPAIKGTYILSILSNAGIQKEKIIVE